MKSIPSVPPQVRSQIERDYHKRIARELASEFNRIKLEYLKCVCYASILALDDRHRDKFGDTDEVINIGYQDFATSLFQIIADYKIEYKDLINNGDYDAITRALEAECKDREIEVFFE